MHLASVLVHRADFKIVGVGGALEPQPRPWLVFPTERCSGKYATNDGAYHKGPSQSVRPRQHPCRPLQARKRPLASPHRPSDCPKPACPQGNLNICKPTSDHLNLPAPLPRPHRPTTPPLHDVCRVPSPELAMLHQQSRAVFGRTCIHR